MSLAVARTLTSSSITVAKLPDPIAAPTQQTQQTQSIHYIGDMTQGPEAIIQDIEPKIGRASCRERV